MNGTTKRQTLRVCMVVHHYYYRDSRIRRYAEGLAAAGAQVDVLCLQEPGHLETEAQDNLRVLALPLKRSATSSASYLITYAWSFVVLATRLLGLYLQRRYHVIHVHNMPDSLVFVALLPRLFGAKVILDIHDPMPEFYIAKYRRHPNALVVRLLRVQERWSAAMASAVITANVNFKRQMVGRGVPAGKITVVNNVPDSAVFDRGAYADQTDRDPTFTLIYPGTIAARYGLDVAVRAMPILMATIPNIRLVVMGAGHRAYLRYLEDLAESLGVTASVEILPAVPVDEVPAWLARADIGIYPALPDPHMSIATPSKVLEYAVMGLPIVASRLPVLEDLFGDSAIQFFEPGNVAQFAACIQHLFAAPDRRRALVGEADRIYVATHNWRKEQQAYFALIGSLTRSFRRSVATPEDVS